MNGNCAAWSPSCHPLHRCPAIAGGNLRALADLSSGLCVEHDQRVSAPRPRHRISSSGFTGLSTLPPSPRQRHALTSPPPPTTVPGAILLAGRQWHRLRRRFKRRQDGRSCCSDPFGDPFAGVEHRLRLGRHRCCRYHSGHGRQRRRQAGRLQRDRGFRGSDVARWWVPRNTERCRERTRGTE